MQTRQWSHKYAAHKSASLVIRLTLQALYKFIYSLICPLSKVGIYLKHFLYYQNLATYLVLDIFLLSLNQLITFSTRITTHKNVTCNTVIAQLAIFTLPTTFYATGNDTTYTTHNILQTFHRFWNLQRPRYVTFTDMVLNNQVRAKFCHFLKRRCCFSEVTAHAIYFSNSILSCTDFWSQ